MRRSVFGCAFFLFLSTALMAWQRSNDANVQGAYEREAARRVERDRIRSSSTSSRSSTSSNSSSSTGRVTCPDGRSVSYRSECTSGSNDLAERVRKWDAPGQAEAEFAAEQRRMKSDPHYRRSPFEREQIQAACNQAGRLTSLDAPVQVLAAKGDFGTLVEVSKKSKSSTQFNATRACLSWAAPSARNYSDHFMLGSAYVALGDHRQAMESFDRARSYQGLSSNERGEVLYALGESQYALGLREEARTSAVNSDYFRPSAAAKDLLRRIGTGRYFPPSPPPAAVTISVAPPPVLTSPQTPKPVVAEPLIPGGRLRTTSVHENDFNAVSLRGVQPTIFVRHRIVKGRAFTPGTQEIVIPDEFKSVNRIEIGQPVTIQGRQWILVGVVRSRKWNEVWGDLEAVKKAYGK